MVFLSPIISELAPGIYYLFKKFQGCLLLTRLLLENIGVLQQMQKCSWHDQMFYYQLMFLRYLLSDIYQIDQPKETHQIGRD